MWTAALALLAAPAALAWNYTTQIHRVVTYFDSFNNGTNGQLGTPQSLLPIIEDKTGITDVLLFVCDIQDKAPYVTVGGYDPANTTALGSLWEDAQTLKDNGVNVLTSFGGYTSQMWLIMETDFDFYYGQLHDFLKQYNVSGIDLDIEPSTNTLTSYAKGWVTLKLLKQLDRDFGSEFIITAAPIADDLTGQYNPQFYSGFNYNIMDEMARNEEGGPIINWFNAQFYNGYGLCNNATTYNQIIQYGGWDPSRVVFLVPTSNDVAFGWCPIDQVVSALQTLTANYTTFGGIGGYDYPNAGNTDNLTIAEWFQTVEKAMNGGS